ncbi:hypothetical protein APHAL10511_002165 [Amanita phalloides]|nr:hypothetical protein APHAL10511_002165 [Amanita phalloides]
MANDALENDAQSAKAIRLNIPARVYLVPGAAFTIGAAIGLVREGRRAALRFLAENVHRPPTTVQGWYFYNKSKNYKVMLGGLKGGVAEGGRVAVVGAGWVVLEEGLERMGWGTVKEMGAGMGTACVFSASAAEDGSAGGGAWTGDRRGDKRVGIVDPLHLAASTPILQPPMLGFWPPTSSDQLTPRPVHHDRNPFDSLSSFTPPFVPSAPTSPGSGHTDLTPLSLHAPQFKMQQPPSGPCKILANMPSVASSFSSSSSPPSAPHFSISKGQIHVKLIQARSLNVRSIHARPYVVVQFEQNEFISRDPTIETDKEVKGIATTLDRINSANAIATLAAIEPKPADTKRAKSANSSPSSSISSSKSSGIASGFFGRLSPHNPVWKHEVSFDVTSEDSLVSLNVYDRSVSDLGFLGIVQIKPVLIHDHTVDQWFKLLPLEDEPITGEMRVQITFEQYKVKRTLTPRDFEFLKLIGRGTFGKVFQVRKKDTKRIYAMKVLSKKEIVAKKEIAHTIGERKILQCSLESPFLVGLKFSFQTDTDLYLVTDFKSGGELFWHLQRETRFSEERARFYVAELILALEHLHKYNIVYRDLKPENILLDATGHVALCDFGLSKADLRPDELTTTFCGTTEYLAPEILLDEHGYSKIVDFWSLGVLLFEMCCGWSPFYAEDTQQMYKNICFGKIRFPKGVICEDGKQFVKGLLNRNPKHRLGAQRDAEELKEHPFFKSIDWKALALKQVTPPFKPVVESDESTNNFDPEFTTADIESDVANLDLDEEDPSEDWVSQSIGASNGFVHTPNGPLGSERRYSKANGNTNMSTNGGGIQINRKKRKEAAGSILTNSVQEKFKGFTFSGGDSIVPPSALRARKKADEENAVDDEEVPDVTTEDEVEDTGRSAGRYANMRRKGFGFSTLEDC